MQAVLHILECWVVSMAMAAFAHFGMVMEPETRPSAPVVERVQITRTAVACSPEDKAPADLAHA